MPDPTAEPAAEPATKPQPRGRAKKPTPDVIDQLTAALDPDSPEHDKVTAWLDAAVIKRADELGTNKPRNIIEALVAVMRMVSHVTKDDRNSHGNFNFRGIDAVINALGPAMRAVGVVPQSQVIRYQYGDVEVGQNRTRQAHVQLEVSYTFHYSNADGELSSVTASVPGEAMDSGDKATAKAMSVAMRIALLQTFALPTTEPDPDHYSYERSSAPVATVNDIYAAVGWAAKEDDYAAAFTSLRERFGAELFSLTCKNRQGEEVRADKYLDQAEAATAEHRARKAAEQQDTDAHGPTSDVAAESARTEDARTEDAQPEPTRAPQEDARTEDTATAPAAHPAPETETRAQKQFRQAREELVYHSEVLGVPLAEYVKPLVGDDAGPDAVVMGAPLIKYLIDQRAQVIPVLRDAGRATEAANLDRLGQAFPILVSQLAEEGFARDPEPEPVAH